MKISPLKKVLFTFIASLAIIATLLFLFIVISNNVQQYHNTLETAVTNILLGEENFNHMKKIADLIKKRDRDIQRIAYIAIDHKRPLQFIETMEQISHISNVKITLTADETAGDSQSLIFRAALQGSKQGVRTMLAFIQQLPYQINIQNISFQQDTINTAGAVQTSSSAITQLLLTMKVKTQ